LVTGTLGLAEPATRAAMRAAVAAVKAAGATVLVDVNWRPVFWRDLAAAKAEILDFMGVADLVKISDADLEFLYDTPFVTALLNPCMVRRVVVCVLAVGVVCCFFWGGGGVDGWAVGQTAAAGVVVVRVFAPHTHLKPPPKRTPQTKPTTHQIADKLPAARGVLVTAGDEGAAYCFRCAKSEHTGFVPVFKVDVVDTTGAGDAFTAGFVYKVRRVFL
jgi:fructokinase